MRAFTQCRAPSLGRHGLPLFLAASVFSACALPRRTEEALRPVDAPAMRPMGDATHWRLVEPLTFRIEASTDSVVIPAGFVTDFASIPPRLQSLISPLGPHLFPAVLHDYLYWAQSCTRSQVDSLFLKAMVQMNVPRFESFAMYQAVHRFGHKSWQRNSRERDLGLPRIIPDGDDVPRPRPQETWREYRSVLRAEGLSSEPPPTMSPTFCAHGGPPRS